ALTWSGYATAVCPGTKNVDRISWRRSISRMRGSANGPNSPREISAGFVDPSMIQTEVASKSKDRQTDSLGSDVDTATHLPPHMRRSPSDRSRPGIMRARVAAGEWRNTRCHGRLCTDARRGSRSSGRGDHGLDLAPVSGDVLRGVPRQRAH